MAKVEETKPLMSLNVALQAALFPAQTPPTLFWPHLSLVYGTLPLATRQRLQSEIRNDTRPPIVGSIIRAESIEIWDTEDQDPAKWRKVGSVGFVVGQSEGSCGIL